MENTSLMTTEDGMYELNFASAQRTYCSCVPATEKERVTFFNAINNPTKHLKEMINLEIEVKDIYAETIEFVNRDTGEATPGVRMVLIASDGTSYQASAKGVFSAISKLLKIMGEPSSWKKPVKIRPKEISKGPDRNVLTFDLV